MDPIVQPAFIVRILVHHTTAHIVQLHNIQLIAREKQSLIVCLVQNPP